MGYFKQLDIINQERSRAMGQNAGIDYGMRMSNIDHETGIRYGVINQNEVLQVWADSSEPYYGKPSGAICPHCQAEFDVNQDETKEMVIDWNDEIECIECKEKFVIEFDDFSEPLSFSYNEDGYICHQSADDTDIFIIKSPYYTFAGYCSPCAPGAGYLMSPFTMSKDMPIDDSLPLGGYAAHAIASGFPMVYCFGHNWYEEQETGKMITCIYCKGTGKLESLQYNEKGIPVECWTCHGRGKIKETIQCAPYPVFSVATGELIS
jgi:hypothetical protein